MVMATAKVHNARPSEFPLVWSEGLKCVVYRFVQMQPQAWKNKAIAIDNCQQLPLYVPRLTLERFDGAVQEGVCLQANSFPPGESREQMHLICLPPTSPSSSRRKSIPGKCIITSFPAIVNIY